MNLPIDIVLPWVNDSDPAWNEEKRKYMDEKTGAIEASNLRFQSWDNLHLWFRAIEECMPWANKVFLVTCGQIPNFLVEDHPKVEIVDHRNFIPEEYLPTFNSNTIEMNMYRIKELSENFILFSDDVFPLQPIAEEYYFKDNKVCDKHRAVWIGNGD